MGGRVPLKHPRPPRWIVLVGIFIVMLMGISAAAVAISQPAMVYILTDGDRYERVTMYPGSDEEACEKAGFQNVTVLSREQVENTVYLSLESMFDISIRTAEGSFTVRSKSCTVEEALEANGVSIGPDDIVTPGREEWISENCDISVVRVTYRTETETQDIPFTVETKNDITLLKGQQRITQYGSAGEKEVSYRVTMHDGQEASRELLSEKQTKAPVNCIVTQGVREPQNEQERQAAAEEAVQASQAELPSTVPDDGEALSTAGRSQVWSVPAGIEDDKENKVITAADGSSYEYTAVIDVKATAYHRVEEGGTITASGTTTQYGTIAVDPSVIPLGSRVYVVSNGGDKSWSYGPGLAEDTGGLIKGARIDLFFMTGDEATQFGVRPAKVYILKD